MDLKKPIIAANWKMYKSRHQVEEFFNILLPQLKGDQIWVAPSMPYLHLAAQLVQKSSIWIGAQNISSEEEGAFTGETSAAQVADCGCHFALVGHSERRRLFGETGSQISKKIIQAAQHNLVPLLCVGETLEERKLGQTQKVLQSQLTEALTSSFQGVIAYEPVWAIGTGQSATPEMIEEAHGICRAILRDLCDSKPPILYGGSVTKELAPQLSRIKGVDGALVGGASLEPKSLLAIVEGFRS